MSPLSHLTCCPSHRSAAVGPHSVPGESIQVHLAEWKYMTSARYKPVIYMLPVIEGIHLVCF